MTIHVSDDLLDFDVMSANLVVIYRLLKLESYSLRLLSGKAGRG